MDRYGLWRTLRAWALILALVAPGALPTHSQSCSLVINEFLPAPSPGTEWAELWNCGATPVDLSGWRLDDDAPQSGASVPLPLGRTIAPGQWYVIEWSVSMLNNSGDTIQLIAPGEQVVDTYTYTATRFNESFARIPDGANTWVVGLPTKGQPNTPGSTQTPTSTPTPSTTATPVSPDEPTLTITPTSTATTTPTPPPTSTANPTTT